MFRRLRMKLVGWLLTPERRAHEEAPEDAPAYESGCFEPSAGHAEPDPWRPFQWKNVDDEGKPIRVVGFLSYLSNQHNEEED